MTDLHSVKPAHYDIHERLENWARSVRDRPSAGAMQPMFRFYKPRVPRETTARIEVDQQDARIIERQVSVLPDFHAFVIRWAYVFPWRHEMKVCRMWEVTKDQLCDGIHQGREMLRERLTDISHKPILARKFDSPSGVYCHAAAEPSPEPR